ncbi:energy transducer TonB [Ketobacter sp.]|uniref:energy transducer TonB n=1 Tax=Ketobacter sp. TaxID=2083498 RepID=UPI000F2C889F|nr:energy transducer TonB [Ketobacter sp.]RLT96005.1 MAG: energy transducer TonB [Ketobacter sp.]
MLRRYCIAFVLAFWMVTFLFALMIALIKTSEVPVADNSRLNLVNFIREKRDPNLRLEDLKPEPPPKPSEPPPPAALQIETLDPSGESFAISELPVADSFVLEPGLGIGEGDGEYLPVYRVPPQYPRKALFDRVEGWVVVEFTIGTQGEVKDARVVESSPRGTFDQAALDAVRRFRFKPRNIAGTPVEVQGVQNRIRFKLKK